MKGSFDTSDWPELPPDQRPQNLYVNYLIPEKAKESLHEKGWNVQDVRALPARTDGDRAEGVKAYLEGIRMGSIDADSKSRGHLELEAKIYGLLDRKSGYGEKDSKLTKDTEELLRGFGSKYGNKRISSRVPEKKKVPRKRKKT